MTMIQMLGILNHAAVEWTQQNESNPNLPNVLEAIKMAEKTIEGFRLPPPPFQPTDNRRKTA